MNTFLVVFSLAVAAANASGAGLLAHSLLGHSALVGPAAAYSVPAAAYSVPGVALSHSSLVHPSVYSYGYGAYGAVAPAAALVQGADTDAVVAGPSGTVTRSGGVLAHAVAAPAVYAGHVPLQAYAAPGFIASDLVGDSVVAGPSGTISTSIGHLGQHAAPLVAAHGW